MNGLDLFSGIGGISLALAPWVRPIAYCENDRYAQSVLLHHMRRGSLPCAGIWDDVKTLRADHLGLPEHGPDIIYGGFPCQDISAAGRGEGLGGKRSSLFFEIVRLVEEIRPPFVFLENVPAIRTRGASRVCYELARLGYDLRWTTVSAASVGAPHIRNRWFLLAANADRIELRKLRRWSSGTLRKGSALARGDGAQEYLADSADYWARRWEQLATSGESSGDVADTKGSRLSRREKSDSRGANGIAEESGENDRRFFESSRNCLRREWWATEPDVGRVAHGVPARMDRVRGLGNAVVPLQARVAFKRLAGIEGEI